MDRTIEAPKQRPKWGEIIAELGQDKVIVLQLTTRRFCDMEDVVKAYSASKQGFLGAISRIRYMETEKFVRAANEMGAAWETDREWSAFLFAKEPLGFVSLVEHFSKSKDNADVIVGIVKTAGISAEALISAAAKPGFGEAFAVIRSMGIDDFAEAVNGVMRIGGMSAEVANKMFADDLAHFMESISVTHAARRPTRP